MIPQLSFLHFPATTEPTHRVDMAPKVPYKVGMFQNMIIFEKMEGKNMGL